MIWPMEKPTNDVNTILRYASGTPEREALLDEIKKVRAEAMVNLSKTPYEAEIDLAELVDFWRFNAYYARFIYEQ